MACRFTKVSEEEIVAINEAAFCYSSDLVKINTKTTIPLWVGEERWIHTVPFKSKLTVCCESRFPTRFSIPARIENLSSKIENLLSRIENF